MNRKVLLAVLGILALAVVLVLVLLGCSQDVTAYEVFNAFSGVDCTAPILLSATSESSSVIRLDFSEPVKVYGSSFEPSSARADGKSVFVTLSSTLAPGQKSEIEGRVKDYAGNTCGFSVQVWGLNPRMPQILINEFTTKGTARSPDRTELRISSDGNLNGMTLYGGVPDDWDVCLVFPDLEVRSGDLVVIWWTDSLPEDLSEKEGVMNICANCSDNLSSNNGTLVLCATPSIGAKVIDAVIYSNYSSSHGGFGTKVAQQRASWVLNAGAWVGDAIDITSSTATRSVCRMEDGRDFQSAGDWFVTVTGGSTFGLANTSEAYL